MIFQITIICNLMLIAKWSVVVAIDITSSNDTLSEERNPRVSGRIVKLYSGSRSEPFYCPQEGFQADPTNCAVFYRCIKGANNKFTVFRFQCGPGTVYDPETEVCNFPQNTKRSECGGSPSFSKDKGNENEIESAYPELPSPINRPVYYEPLKESTAYPWVTSKPNNAQSVSSGHTWMTTISYQEPPKKEILHQPSQGKQTVDACTKDGFMSDSKNCRKFYRCVGNQRGGFIRYEFSCSETTIWDDDAQSCNHPWAVQRSHCGKSNSNSNSIPNSSNPTDQSSSNQQSTMQQQLQVTYGNKVTQTQTQIAHGPVIQNQTQINYGNRDNKQQGSLNQQNQTQISHGSAISQSQTQINYGNGIQTQLQVDHTKDSSQSQAQVYETTSKPLTTITNDLEDEQDHGYGNEMNTQGNGDKESNRNECTESGFMGDKNDCKKFYRCVDNGKGGYTRYEFSCGEGTVWDSSIEACNHVWAVKQCGGKAPQVSSQVVPQTTTSTTKPTQNYPTTSAMTTDDENYDPGYGNQPQPETSSTTTTAQPKPGTTITNTEASSSSGNFCTSSGFMGDPNNCKKFYRCVDNGNGGYTRYEFTCGEGTVWDPNIEACNHAWAVETCGGNSSGDIYKDTTSSSRPTTLSDEEINSYPTQTSDITTKSTDQPNIIVKPGKECSQEGFMGDENDCKRFYRCVDNGHGGFLKYEFSCGEGTVWDPKITACNHPNSVKGFCNGTSTQGENIPETSGDSTTEQESQTTNVQSTEEPKTTEKPSSSSAECSQEGFMGDDNNCQKFYRCVDNGRGGFIKYEFTCGEGTVWDSEIQACNHPSSDGRCKISSSGSQSNVSKEPDHESDEIYTESSDTTVSSTRPSQTTESTTTQNQSPSDKCINEGFYGDSDNCKKFYRCVDNGKGEYTKYEFTCGDGTIWDQEIQACNHEPRNSNCSKQMSQSATTESDNGTSSTIAEQQSTQGTLTSESDDTCVSEGFYANLNDCRKFYRCVDNSKGGFTKYDFTCGEGTIWVQEIQACDHDTDKSCSSQSSSTSSSTETVKEQQPSTSSTENTPNQLPDKQNDENLQETSPSSSNSESDKCSSEGFYANQHDCKKFYRCVDNGQGGYTKYDFTCGEGTAWDANIQTCNHITEVKNCEGQGQEYGQPMQDEEETQSSDDTTQTSTSGPTTNSPKPTSNDTCQQEGYYGNSQDCTKFYRCVDNGNNGYTKYDFDCGEGTIWDQDITTCNHPQDVSNPSCKKHTNDDSSSSSSTTSEPSSSSTTESSGSSSDCSQQPNKKPDNKNINCTKAGYYPDPNDCKKFYRCVDWDGDGNKFSVYHFECGEGTIWDPALDTCNHEDSVYPPRDCSGTQSQGENVDQETSMTETTTTLANSETTPESTNQDSTSELSTEESSTEQTTIKQSTTEQSTTQQMTTTQDSSTQETTTKESTTQKSTTQESTTQESTTQESATQESTTQESTTQKSTTQESTTQKTTTQESTTHESTTQESTTRESTTQESTTQESTTQSDSTDHTTSTTESDNLSTTTTTEGTTSQTEENQTTESAVSTTSQNNETTESVQDSTTESGGQETTESISSDKECPETDKDQNLFVCTTSFKRHPKYCNLFYQCTEDDDTHDVQIATFHCPNNTIYDESKTQCVEEKKADKKCDGEIAAKRRVKRLDTINKEPLILPNERLKCPAPGHYPFEKGECSPAFLKCQKAESGKIRGYIYQCPQGFVYWSVSRRCETKSHVRDCKDSHNVWDGRWEIPTERRNVAP